MKIKRQILRKAWNDFRRNYLKELRKSERTQWLNRKQFRKKYKGSNAYLYLNFVAKVKEG